MFQLIRADNTSLNFQETKAAINPQYNRDLQVFKDKLGSWTDAEFKLKYKLFD